MRVVEHKFTHVVGYFLGEYDIVDYEGVFEYNYEESERVRTTILPALDGHLIYVEWWSEDQEWQVGY